ncbi:MAG: acetolactate synthase small subunit [Candidatus Margulisbacteria bacterium]|nr:acetolactate synthase small subunit [Candidatus Margulisiibacteriota bacterium]MBU1021743.1 acetolactate synthase small subunit [Candidatus Margulisiibacteriota bacterium]MBU1729489.1 acetolactate synthase small subunit [Candidatus Margulisiibacteriota bacterium]MBU1955410.1 acetolactate synthase small subunit [Candidatus Margulisiibacteriota bacterium]
MKHTISVLVENHPGVLNKVAGLFARRGFNIDSLAVGTTEDPQLSRMTIVVHGDDQVLEQIQKQLYKLINVIKVFDLPPDKSVDRELVLVKVAVNAKNRAEITELVDIFRGKIADVGETAMTIELAGDSSKVEGAIKLLEKFGIKEMVRTGKIALLRGSDTK